jgi:uncharacterized protein YegL
MSSENLEQHKIGHFGFSAVHVDSLAASGYTLVTIVCDRSGSTSGFQKEMESALKEVIKACQSSPRADNLLMRVITFDNTHSEFHGFKMLESINLGDYDGSLNPGGSTALFDAMINGIEGTNNYAKQLAQQDFDVNAILFFITDGDDNASTYGINQIKDALGHSVRSEDLESMVTILLGVNVKEQHFKNRLETVHKDCGLTQFEFLENASAKTLAKLANFVSQSISSQSQALGSGGPSKSINF